MTSLYPCHYVVTCSCPCGVCTAWKEIVVPASLTETVDPESVWEQFRKLGWCVSDEDKPNRCPECNPQCSTLRYAGVV